MKTFKTILLMALMVVPFSSCKGNTESSGFTDISESLQTAEGNKTEKLSGKAADWYDKAQAGDAEAQNHLGFCYLTGQGVAVDYNEAVSWFQKAAKQGNADAQYFLGECYFRGHGVPRDLEQSAKWNAKAATHSEEDFQYPEALCGLGNLFLNVMNDKKQAIKWYRASARKGFVDAQQKLKELGESW